MLAILERAEWALGNPGRSLLDDPEGWETLLVNYEPPWVERLWRDFEGGYRLYLHRIYPCEKALFHPHPWPSAIKVLSGSYEMGVGYRHSRPGENQRTPDWTPSPPPIAATIVLTPGSSYEMIEPAGWHYVKPLVGPSLSIMVTGPKWGAWSPKANHKLGPVTAEAKADLLSVFRHLYRRSP